MSHVLENWKVSKQLDTVNIFDHPLTSTVPCNLGHLKKSKKSDTDMEKHFSRYVRIFKKVSKKTCLQDVQIGLIALVIPSPSKFLP